jgi:hypothetical protein
MRSVCVGLVALVVLVFSSSAQAAPCGAPGAAGEEPTLGSLKLRAEESEPNVNAGRSVDERRMVFVFDVEDCTLSANEDIDAKVRSSDLDRAVFEEAEIEPERTVLFVDIPVKPDEFDSGKHSAIVTVSGPNLNPSVSKVTLQRSENRWYIPVGICLVAALLAFAALALRARAEADEEEKTEFHLLWLVATLAAALGAAGVVCKTTYFEPEVWAADFVSGALLFIGAITAAAGATTVVVRKAWSKKKAPAAGGAGDAKARDAVTPRAG